MSLVKSVVSLSVAFAWSIAFLPAPASALTVLGSDLGSFAVLAGSTVTNSGASIINGNLGVYPGTSITGSPTVINGATYTNSVAGLAQTELTSAMTTLGHMGVGTTLTSNLTGMTLLPGVYTVPAGATNLAGKLTLNGNGNANASWVFQMPSTLITSSDSVVNVIDAGAGASLYWDVRSSATIGSNTTFEGNILALASISLDPGATISCGRALASVSAVTMVNNDVSNACTSTGVTVLGGSGGLNGSGSGSLAATPESTTAILFGLGLAGLLTFRKRLAFTGSI